jgi:hypothetical protein
MSSCDLTTQIKLYQPLWLLEEPIGNYQPCTGESLGPDFILDYVRYADVIEAPPAAHEAVAISLLAAVLNKKVYFKNGPMKLSLDLWVLLLSGSGLGRNTLVRLARPILEKAELIDLIRTDTWGSREAFFQNIADNPTGLFLWPEISSVLKKLNDKSFAGAKEWITNCFDEWTIPDAVRYRVTGKKSDTPSIVFDKAPRTNLLATSSYDWFIGSLEEQDSTGGFIPRWMIIQLEDPIKLVPIPQETDQTLVEPLAEQLRKASELEGEADLSCVKEMYKDWYKETNKRFIEQPNKALAMPFFNRMRTNVLKLAVIFEVSRSGNLIVSSGAMVRAIEFAFRAEQILFSLLPTGMNREGSEVEKIAARVNAAGADGLSRSALTRAFQSMKARDRNERIQTLIEAGIITSFLIKTTGRGLSVYVHKDRIKEYSEKHPHQKSP